MPAVRPKVTILIKALNEEHRIAKCLDAAVREAASVNGDVILVDSLSTDRTLEIAKNYPIRIVQFKNIDDRGCGAAVQLGYQYVDADFIYVLDADMVLNEGFLKLALDVLEGDSSIAGVGGKLLDLSVRTAADIRRVESAAKLVGISEVTELGGGGLYRSDAIRASKYLAHRYLKAFEEAELGIRLRAGGWRLIRLPDVAVFHEGHSETTMGMMVRLWRNKRAEAGGALIKSSLGKPWFLLAARKQAYILCIYVAHIVAAVVSLVGDATGGYSWWFGYSLVVIALFALMVIHKRSVTRAFEIFVIWHFFALAALPGFFKRLGNPISTIEATECQDNRLRVST